eukprot:GHVR01043527.1.p1 GENE.GHVR01043527.1~~GHVR01043527.1.p1  ORF type:complete len:115 (-),score=4.17 GHVR01043527.1:4303-4647(-)
MGLLKGIQNVILRMDLLSAKPTMRVRGESSYESYCGGCLSLILIITFVTIFAGSFINVIKKVEVIATLENNDNPDSEKEIQNLRIAFGIDGIDLSSTKYFKMVFEEFTVDHGVP